MSIATLIRIGAFALCLAPTAIPVHQAAGHGPATLAVADHEGGPENSFNIQTADREGGPENNYPNHWA